MSDQIEFNRKLIEEFRATRGSLDGPFAKRPLVLLTTTGVKTGQPRTTPVMYIREGERLLVVASNAGAAKHPAWFLNLSAHPILTVELGAETFEARALILTGADREQLWQRVVEKYPFFGDHQAKIERQIPIVELQRIEPKPV